MSINSPSPQQVYEPQGIVKISKLRKATKKIVMSTGEQFVFKPASGERKGFCVTSGRRYVREIVAYEIAKVLGLDQVPETTVAKVKGQVGALQRYVVGCHEFKDLPIQERGEAVKKLPAKVRVRAAAYDFLIGNTDRHRSNYFILGENELHLIDHGLTLHRKSNTGKVGRLIQASKKLVIPNEVKDWVSHWPQIKSIAMVWKIPYPHICAMQVRLLALWNSKTIGDALKSVRNSKTKTNFKTKER